MNRKQTKSALASTRLETKLITPSIKPQMNTKAVMDEINELKIQTIQMDNETRQLKSKISRMKQIIHERNSQISKALAQTGEPQGIKTASYSTLNQLRENISSLDNTLRSREKELDKLRQNDKLALSDELQVEVIEYYNENDRLNSQVSAVREGERVINNEIARVQQEIADEAQYEREIYDYQIQIGQLADKLKAYLNGEYRVIANTAVEQMEKNSDLYPKLKEKLLENIEEMKKEKQEEEENIKIILENDEKKKQYLQEILEDQAKKIAEALEQQKQRSEEQKQSMNS
ncbi:hypothetical protein M9Y10_012555 [Tritrichomonas musculus]|uniref:Uncharacterized protein n=1 Tax=Tritrichomonas musculus TaxID=1915356 RepID=A0ABR2IDW6_9EUKA